MIPANYVLFESETALEQNQKIRERQSALTVLGIALESVLSFGLNITLDITLDTALDITLGTPTHNSVLSEHLDPYCPKIELQNKNLNSKSKVVYVKLKYSNNLGLFFELIHATRFNWLDHDPNIGPSKVRNIEKWEKKKKIKGDIEKMIKNSTKKT